MEEFQLIKTMPGESKFEVFAELPRALYPQESQRFTLGHDPVTTHLEGCYVLLNANEPVGRFALYANPHLIYQGAPAACIGSYECVDDGPVGDELINRAIDLVNNKGYRWLIGPMEGSTWNTYRFSLHNTHRNFFLEPYHHTYYNDQFVNAGFKEIASYYSHLDTHLNYDIQEQHELEQGYLKNGAVFRNLDLTDLRNELVKLAQLSLEAFCHNFLFTPIEVEEFVSKYEKVGPLLDPDLIWLVEDQDHELHALIFGVQDFQGPAGETVITKSLARKRSSPFHGMGTYLIGKLNETARKKGYKKGIHAMMIKDNASRRISEHFEAHEFKSYALYGRAL